MKLSPVYEPKNYETDIYRLWEESGAFAPKNRGGKTYSIVVPPPNANGNLHIGHALTFALQDIAIRYHRMKGDATLFVPGADHAGFETQVVYERELAKQGKSRFDLSRDELYDQIWKFVSLNRENYEGQFRRLGASVDWDHFTFTLDDKVVDRAYKTFQKMWQEGLIYRGTRLVNFCTFHGTAFADIEVEYKDEAGHLWEISYPLTDGSGEVVVATTRPETLLGDTAVAVHPKDKRYAKLIGKTVKLPLTQREIPIIADEMVDREFGTGAVKITPAHDPNDFEVGERHDLPKITVIGHDGLMTPDAGEAYRGQTVADARTKVVSDLKAAGRLRKVTDHRHSVGHCYKCGTVIQPLLREQWFVDMKPLAQKAISALKDNRIKFYPSNKQDQLIRYLEGLKDWNISRQIAWGIPIPAFQNMDDDQDWIFDERVGEEFITVGNATYRRDPDVFDTWFSSGQWPFVTLDYPDSQDFNNFYPLSVMETGVDILAPWVSRMIMLGLYVTGKVPFTSVYLHGMVLDEHGAKMSKSKGNVVNPIDIADKYGSDALRMGIITGQSAGNNQPFGVPKVVGARNFCNKLWNIARYIEGKIGNDYPAGNPSPETIADHWVLNVLQQSSQKIARLLDEYRFAEAYDVLYHTVWDEVADWYIEASKSEQGRGMLAYVLETTLAIAHPFAPFVTETIWQTLGWQKDTLLVTTLWPKGIKGDVARATQFEELREVITEARQLARAMKVSKPRLVFSSSDLVRDNQALIRQLAQLSEVAVSTKPHGIRLVTAEAWLEVGEKDIKRYLGELEAHITEAAKIIDSLKKRLSNKSYLANAPAHVVQQTKDQLAITEAEHTVLAQQLKRFKTA